MVSEPKSYSRGQVVFQQGDPADTIFIVTSGIISLFLKRGQTSIEIAQVSAGQILGEETLWSLPVRNFSAVANNPVSLVAIDTSTAQTRLNQSTPLLRVLSTGLLAKHRRCLEALLEIKLRAHPLPCPLEKVTKLFAVLYHCASYTGTPKGGSISVVWPAFKKYAQRTFLESPVRLEQGARIMVKLGFAKLEYVPCEEDPLAPDELGFVHFHQLEIARTFFEYYRAFQASLTPLPPLAPEHRAILDEIHRWNLVGKVMLNEKSDAA